MSEYYISVKSVGMKRARLLASDGYTTRLRVHAVIFRDKEDADATRSKLAEANPNLEFRLQPRQ